MVDLISYVYVLMARTCECELIWRKGLCKCKLPQDHLKFQVDIKSEINLKPKDTQEKVRGCLKLRDTLGEETIWIWRQRSELCIPQPSSAWSD
jgi:hypothetical protein